MKRGVWEGAVLVHSSDGISNLKWTLISHMSHEIHYAAYCNLKESLDAHTWFVSPSLGTLNCILCCLVVDQRSMQRAMCNVQSAKCNVYCAINSAVQCKGGPQILAKVSHAWAASPDK